MAQLLEVWLSLGHRLGIRLGMTQLLEVWLDLRYLIELCLGMLGGWLCVNNLLLG